MSGLDPYILVFLSMTNVNEGNLGWELNSVHEKTTAVFQKQSFRGFP